MNTSDDALPAANQHARADDVLEEVISRRAFWIGFFFRRTNNLEDAEDLVQELWLKALRSATLRRGCVPLSDLQPWLTRVAVNLAIDAARKRALRSTFPLPDDFMTRAAGEPVEVNDDPTTIPHVLRSLALLGEPRFGERPLSYLSIVEHIFLCMEFDEIAANHGVSERQVRREYDAGLRHLRMSQSIDALYVGVDDSEAPQPQRPLAA